MGTIAASININQEANELAFTSDGAIFSIKLLIKNSLSAKCGVIVSEPERLKMITKYPMCARS
jgi:hypothetical protein